MSSNQHEQPGTPEQAASRRCGDLPRKQKPNRNRLRADVQLESRGHKQTRQQRRRNAVKQAHKTLRLGSSHQRCNISPLGGWRWGALIKWPESSAKHGSVIRLCCVCFCYLDVTVILQQLAHTILSQDSTLQPVLKQKKQTHLSCI